MNKFFWKNIDKKKLKRSFSRFIKKVKKVYFKLVENSRIIIISLCILFTVVAFYIIQKNSLNSLKGMLKTGQSYEKCGKIATALNVYSKIVRAYPNSYEAHMRLGNAYKQVNEPEKAKIEYYRAIKLTNTDRYDAYFAMSDLYVSENEYELAQSLLVEIIDVPNKTVAEKIGDFYYSWANNIKKSDQPEAIRKYKLSYDFYSRCNSDKVPLIRKTIENTYLEIADSLLAINNVDEAVKLLNTSINYLDNANAHYKLAEIYEKKNPDRAINEYTKAFALNNSAINTDRFAKLLENKADNLYKKGDKLTAKLYYDKAKSLSPNIIIPYINDSSIIVNLIAFRASKDENKQVYTPGISFKITNISKNEIKYIKAKIIFNVNGQKYSEETKDISTSQNPLSPFSITPLINVYSTKPLSCEYQYSKPKVEVLIYISQQPDKWKIFRSTHFVDSNQENEPKKIKTKSSIGPVLSKSNNCNAYFAMVDLYVTRNEYERAQDLLAQIQDVPRKIVSDKIGDFYYKWGNSFKTTNQLEAIRKYKLAYEFYSRYKGDKASTIRKAIGNTYSDAADNLIKINNFEEATKLLNLSINYTNNAKVHYKLARIYEKRDIDKAITEFTKAFALNSTIAPNDRFVQLLVKKADYLYKKGDKINAGVYYNKAKKLDSRIKIPYISDNSIIVNSISAKIRKDTSKYLYIPAISFKITNTSKNEIKYIKAKVIFNVDGSKYSEEIKEITTLKNPLHNFSSTQKINIYSSKPIRCEYQYSKPKVEILIYISQQQPDKWKIYRSTYAEYLK